MGDAEDTTDPGVVSWRVRELAHDVEREREERKEGHSDHEARLRALEAERWRQAGAAATGAAIASGIAQIAMWLINN